MEEQMTMVAIAKAQSLILVSIRCKEMEVHMYTGTPVVVMLITPTVT